MEHPMTMNRVIHAAVRRDLARLEAALADAPNGNGERSAGLRDAYAFLQGQLVHHHESEDALVFPALARLQVDATLLGEMEAEHHAMADALHSTRAAMERYGASGSATDAQAARERVAHARQVTERHLAHEEQELEPAMIAHFESEEWQAVQKQLRRQSPRVAGPFFAWIEDGMGPEEQQHVESTVPAPVRWVMSRVFGRTYHREIAPVWRAQ